MADSHYTLEITITGDGEQSAVASPKGSTEKTTGEKSAAALEKGLKGLVSYAAIAGTANQMINAEIGRIELSTGAAEYQARVQQTYSLISSGVNSVAKLGMGAAVGGVPGLIIAGISVVTDVAQSLLDVMQKQITLSKQEAVENVSIGFARNRASTNGRRQ